MRPRPGTVPWSETSTCSGEQEDAGEKGEVHHERHGRDADPPGFEEPLRLYFEALGKGHTERAR